MINATVLAKSYDATPALSGVSLSVSDGSLYGLIGADGAGKTTLIRILTTLIRQDSGSATVMGHDTVRERDSIRHSIGYMPQRFSLYQDLSVQENLAFFADIFGVKGAERAQRIEHLLAFARLTPFTRRRAANLSGGMKQKLALCCCLVHRPRVLFLDEPTVGVDPVSRREFWDILRSLRNEGITILVSTPYMDEAEYCDRLAILHKGTVMCEGRPADLTAAYPLDLYAVVCDHPPAPAAEEPVLPAGIAELYPAAGALYGAAVKGSPTADVLARLQALVPEATGLRPAPARIEDLFVHLAGREPPESSGASHSAKSAGGGA